MTSQSHMTKYVSRGLTLLELVVAMVILSIGIVGLLRAYSHCVITSKAAESYSVAAMLSQQALGELQRMPNLQPGKVSGDFAQEELYRWEGKVGQADANGLLPVRLNVIWQVGNQERQFELQGYIRPASEPASEGDAPDAGGTP